MKQQSYFFTTLFLGVASVVMPNALCQEAAPRDSFDDLIELVDTTSMSDLIDETVFADSSTSKETVINILEAVNAFGLLQENFFLRTNNLNSRSLLDYPEFLAWRHDKDKRGVYVDFFYNQFSRLNFTKQSSNICSYLAVSQESFLGTLQKIIQNATPLANDLPSADEILRLVELFQTFTVQERRLGVMIGGKTSYQRWHFHIFAPWYYLERNHFVDLDVQEDLEALFEDLLGAPATPQLRAQAEAKQKTFQDSHLISDKFGIGDTRIYIDYPIIKRAYWSTRLGFLATIPTAAAFKKGLKGASLHRITYPPALDLVNIVDSVINQTPISQTNALSFGIAALDNLSAILLDTPMGNGGHFGLGVTARNRSPLSVWIKQEWASRIISRNFVSLEYLFPATELRSYRIPVNQALFNARNLTDTSNLEVINSNYAFIVQQLSERIFPIALETRVYPGFIFRWCSQSTYEGNRGGFSIGTDTYVRNKEHLGHINASPALLALLDKAHASSPLAYQSKIFGSVFGKINKHDTLFTIALMGDYTYTKRGIGDDFTLGLSVHATF